MPVDVDTLTTELTKRLSESGRLIGAGFIIYRQQVMAQDAPDIQVRECMLAFYAGAQHLFGSIMTALDEDAEPTEADLKRMDLIATELQEFVKLIKENDTDARH